MIRNMEHSLHIKQEIPSTSLWWTWSAKCCSPDGRQMAGCPRPGHRLHPENILKMRPWQCVTVTWVVISIAINVLSETVRRTENILICIGGGSQHIYLTRCWLPTTIQTNWTLCLPHVTTLMSYDAPTFLLKKNSNLSFKKFLQNMNERVSLIKN